MAKIKLASLIIVFLAGILLNFGLADSVQAALSCSVKTTCDTVETAIFKMSDLSNAHAATSGSSYLYSACCSGATGLGTDCGAANKAVFLRFSSTTNAHVEEFGLATPAQGYSDVCLSASLGPAIVCSYSSGSCPTGSACLASISADTNAHVGDCVTAPVYDTRVCCSVVNAVVVTTDDASNIIGTSVILNGTLVKDGGSACSASFVWGDTNSYGETALVTGQKTEGQPFSSDNINVPAKGKIYHFKAKAQNVALSLTGEGLDKTFIIPPDAPLTLTAIAARYDQINLTWATGTGAASTVIRRGAGSCPVTATSGVQACGGPISGTSCSDTGLTESTNYCYRAWSLAQDEGIDIYSSGSNSASATTLSKVVVTTLYPPDFITGISATLKGTLVNNGGENCTTSFKWGDAAVSENQQGYSKDQTTGTNFGFVLGGSISPLDKGTAYHYQAAASNSYMSAVGEEKTFITLPDAPTGLAANAISYSRIDLSWTGNGEGAKSTVIKRGEGSCPDGPGNGALACEVLVPGKSCSDIVGLKEGTDYCYRAWSLASEEGLTAYSAGYSEAWASTPIAPPFDFTISLAPVSGSINRGSQVVSTITVTLTLGATQQISFSTSSLPFGTPVSFSPSSCTPSGNPAVCSSTMTIQTTASTPLGNYSIDVHGNGGGKDRSAPFSLTVKIAGAGMNPPTVVTNPADQITKTSARLHGNLTDMGGALTCLVWFEWGEDPNNLTNSNYATALSMNATGTISLPDVPLSPNKTYYFRARAKNGGSW